MTLSRKLFAIGDRTLSENAPCYIVAEIGVNFDGCLDTAKESIVAAAHAGADAVKFQTFHAEEFVADKSLEYSYTQADGCSVTETQYEMFKRLELSDAWHDELQNYAKDVGVDFFSSAADTRAVDLLVSLRVPVLKLASEDLINVRLLEYVAKQQVPVILSTGMADEFEIAQALEFFSNREVMLLHCVSAYPTPLEQINLRRIVALRERFNITIGFSDHTEGIDAAIASIGVGAALIEKHFTIDNTRSGPDHKLSSDPQEFAAMVQGVRRAEQMLGRGGLDYAPIEAQGRLEFRRSIVAARGINSGEVIAEDMLNYKRPGGGLKPYERGKVIGKVTKAELSPDDLITLDMVE